MAQGFTKGIPIATDPTMAINSDLVVPSQAAVIAYVASQLAVAGVSAVTATAPLASSGGATPNISMSAANLASDGYITSVDYSNFSNKLGSLNGLSASTQSFATGTIGIDFNIASVGSTHTFNIPDAGASARGLITTGIQTIAGQKTFTSTLTVSGNSLFQVISSYFSTGNGVGQIQGTTSGATGFRVVTSAGLQFVAEDTAFLLLRRLRMYASNDGNSYIEKTIGFGATSVAADLIFRIHSTQTGVLNTGALRFRVNSLSSPSTSYLEKMAITPTGVIIGDVNTGALNASTARLELTAGVAAVNGAPLRFNVGVNLTTSVQGAVEFDGTNLFFTRVATRESVWTGNSGATAPTTAAWATPTNYYGANITNALGTPNSWGSVVIGGTTYKIPLYT